MTWVNINLIYMIIMQKKKEKKFGEEVFEVIKILVTS